MIGGEVLGALMGSCLAALRYRAIHLAADFDLERLPTPFSVLRSVGYHSDRMTFAYRRSNAE